MPTQTNSPYTPTPQNPSYTGTAQHPAAGGSMTVTGNVYSGSASIAPAAMGQLVSLNTTGGFSVLTLTGSNDITWKMKSIDKGQPLTLEFAPDPAMTMSDLVKITLLLQLISNGGMSFASDAIAYIRKHSLERHFNITADSNTISKMGY